MTHKKCRPAARDGQPFQLPAADLVFDPQQVLARVEEDIRKFIALDQQLGERALHLAEDLNTLTRYNIASPELVRQICQIILKTPLYLNVPKSIRGGGEERGVGGNDGDGGDDYIYISPSMDKSSPETGVVKGGCAQAPTPIVYTAEIVQSLCDHLVKLGIDGAASLIQEYGPDRVGAKLMYALDQPEGKIKDLPGYIIASVVGRSGKGSPGKPADRYLKGRYGHLVQH